ncbi:MAG: DUF3386 family protein [Planctomycetaceae bacterium]
MKYHHCVVASGVLLVTLTAIHAESRKTDSPAREQMLRVHDARAVWNDFPGFTAELAITDGGVQQQCTIRVHGDCKYEVSLPEAERPQWLKAKLDSVISHRRPDRFDEVGYAVIVEEGRSDGTTLIDKLDGSGQFRVRDGEILEIHRKTDKSWLEIYNIDTHRNTEGQVLPSVSAVTIRDPHTGDVKSSRCNTFEWTRVGAFDLPARAVTVEVGNHGEHSSRELVFRQQQLTPKNTSVSQR